MVMQAFKRTLVLGAIGLGSLALAEDARADAGELTEPIFRELDRNGDFLVEKDEALSLARLIVGGFFDKVDRDDNGVASIEELELEGDSMPAVRRALIAASTLLPREASAAAGARVADGITLAQTLSAADLVVDLFFDLEERDGDGALSEDELASGLASIVGQLFGAYFFSADVDRNGFLSLDEHEAAMRGPSFVVFGAADVDGDGQLSMYELREVAYFFREFFEIEP